MKSNNKSLVSRIQDLKLELEQTKNRLGDQLNRAYADNVEVTKLS